MINLVYRSLGILFLAIFLPTLLPASAICAGEIPVDIGTISVEGEHRPASLSVTTITREEIVESEAGSAAGILFKNPSIQVTTGARGEKLIQLRGFDQLGVLILIDGVPSAVPFDGVIDLGKFPLSMIERIEVIKGAAPIVYGPGGLGGAINIITRQPQDVAKLDAAIEGSPPYEMRGSIAHATSIGPVHYAVFGSFDQQWKLPLSSSFSGSANQPSGDRIGSERTSGAGGGRIDIDVADTQKLSIAGNVIGGNYEIPPSTTNARPRYWRYDPWIAATASLTHSGYFASDRIQTSETLFVSPFTNTLKAYDDSSYTTQSARSSFTSIYDDVTAGGFGRLNAKVISDKYPQVDLAMWVGGRYEQHHEESGPDEATYSHWLFTAAPQIELGLAEQATFIAGAQIDAELPDRFAGLVEPDNHFTAGPFAQLSVDPHEHICVELSVARRARFPTLKERFADAFGQRIPNPNLSTETAWHMSLDLALDLPKNFNLTVSAFNSEVWGLIVRTDVGGGKYQLQNAGRARMTGVETMLSLLIEPINLDISGGYQFLDAKRLDVAFPESQLEYRPEHKALAKLSWNPISEILFTTDAVIVGPRPALDIDAGAWRRLATSATWNMRLEGHLFKKMKLWIAATNILDANNISEIGYPDPGRMVWAGASVLLGKPKR